MDSAMDSSPSLSSSSSLLSTAVANCEERDWLDLPLDVVCIIFHKLGAIDTLTLAQLVCCAWRSVARDPLIWRTVDMANSGNFRLGTVCRRAIDYSSGHLRRINIEYFATDDLIHYITDSTSHLQCLRLAFCFQISDKGLCEVAEKLSQLEDLDISISNLSKSALEAIGRSCPNLKSLKYNLEGYRHPHVECDEEAFVIAETMPALRHLQLFGNKLTNQGLLAILDGCPHLESLDIRQCFNVNLGGSLGSRCAQQFRHLQLPYDPIDDYAFEAEIDHGSLDEDYPFGISDMNFFVDDDYDYYGFSDGSDFAEFDFERDYDY